MAAANTLLDRPMASHTCLVIQPMRGEKLGAIAASGTAINAQTIIRLLMQKRGPVWHVTFWLGQSELVARLFHCNQSCSLLLSTIAPCGYCVSRS